MIHMIHLKHLKHLKHFVFPCILLLAVATLLLRTGFADAAPASRCGQWNIVKSPNVGSTSILNGVAAVSTNDVWAVGYSTGYQPLAEHWNGASWHVVSTPKLNAGGILYGLAVVSANDIWAVGRDFAGLNGKGLTEHWDGTQWSLVPSPNVQAGSALFGVTAISTNNVWAVGFFNDTSNGSTSYTLVEHWNGISWHVVASPTPSNPIQNPLLSVSAVSANDIWAVGNGNNEGISYTTLAEHWNGSSWSIVNSPNVGSISLLNGVAAVSTHNVWAVGGGGNNNALIEHWNGTSWSAFNNPGSSLNGTTMNGVTVLSASNIWAVGSTTNSSNVTQTFIERWNGTRWSIVGSPNAGSTNNGLNAVASVPGTSQVWAVGSHGASSTSKTLTEFYC